MAHEELERSVVWIREVVDALVKADVAKAVVLDLCKKRGGAVRNGISTTSKRDKGAQ
jgi:C-terminal processing protease CtpA/Prc